MSNLLKIIRHTSSSAALALERADIHTDSDIQSLTLEDLRELLPGSNKIKLRRTVFQIIQKHNSIEEFIRKGKVIVQDENFSAALTNSEVLDDYVHILKKMKTQLSDVIDDSITQLEERRAGQLNKKSGATASSTSGLDMPNGRTTSSYLQQPLDRQQQLQQQGTSDITTSRPLHADQDSGKSQKSKKSSFSVPFPPKLKPDTVKYQMVVAGQTFGAHQQLMDKMVAASGNQVFFTESSEDHLITLLFCPITSRIESDVEGAMCHIKDEKPVILVLMHHTHQSRSATSTTPRLLNHDPRIVLHVTVYFHETKNGLLTCDQNDTAAFSIRSKLMEYKTPGNAVNHKDSSSRWLSGWLSQK